MLQILQVENQIHPQLSLVLTPCKQYLALSSWCRMAKNSFGFQLHHLPLLVPFQAEVQVDEGRAYIVIIPCSCSNFNKIKCKQKPSSDFYLQQTSLAPSVWLCLLYDLCPVLCGVVRLLCADHRLIR